METIIRGSRALKVKRIAINLSKIFMQTWKIIIIVEKSELCANLVKIYKND